MPTKGPTAELKCEGILVVYCVWFCLQNRTFLEAWYIAGS